MDRSVGGHTISPFQRLGRLDFSSMVTDPRHVATIAAHCRAGGIAANAATLRGRRPASVIGLAQQAQVDGQMGQQSRRRPASMPKALAAARTGRTPIPPAASAATGSATSGPAACAYGGSRGGCWRRGRPADGGRPPGGCRGQCRTAVHEARYFRSIQVDTCCVWRSTPASPRWTSVCSGPARRSHGSNGFIPRSATRCCPCSTSSSSTPAASGSMSCGISSGDLGASQQVAHQPTPVLVAVGDVLGAQALQQHVQVSAGQVRQRRVDPGARERARGAGPLAAAPATPPRCGPGGPAATRRQRGRGLVQSRGRRRPRRRLCDAGSPRRVTAVEHEQLPLDAVQGLDDAGDPSRRGHEDPQVGQRTFASVGCWMGPMPRSSGPPPPSDWARRAHVRAARRDRSQASAGAQRSGQRRPASNVGSYRRAPPRSASGSRLFLHGLAQRPTRAGRFR